MTRGTAPQDGFSKGEATSVLVDGRALTDSSSFRGMGRYLEGLLSGLARRDDVAVTVLSSRADRVPEGLGYRKMPLRMDNRFGDREHAIRLASALRRSREEVFHSPAQDPPSNPGRPWAFTLHGLMSRIEIPDAALDSERRRWRTLATRAARADAVIAVSTACADEGIRRLSLDPRRIHVIHHGVADRFRVAAPEPPADPPYILYVGEHGVGTGHPAAYEVVARLADRGAPHVLKVAGRIVPWHEAEMRRLVAESRRPDHVELLGYVGSELPALYRKAAAVLMTSHESFGLPAVEAMASGVPVVAFGYPAYVEVIADGGVIVEPGDTAAMALTLQRIFANPDLDAELRAKAMERARSFSWDTCAQQHAEVYRSLA